MNGSRMLARGMWFVTRTGGRLCRRRSTRSAAEEGANAEDDRAGGSAARTEIFAGVGALDAGASEKEENSARGEKRGLGEKERRMGGLGSVLC